MPPLANVAAATAAYRVLSAHYPGQRETLDDNYAIALEAEPDAKARAAGQAIGEAAARAALASGAIDPSIAQVPYRPRATAGVWAPTGLPVYQPYSTALPVDLPRVDAVRPPPPPALNSAIWRARMTRSGASGGATARSAMPVAR